MPETIIECPNCKARFDIKSAYDEVRHEILEKLDEIIKESREALQ